MKRFIALVFLCLCGIVSAQKVIVSPIVPGSGTGGGGAITGAYSFNGPFTVTDGTNVFISATISNLVFNLAVTNVIWTTNLLPTYNLGQALSNIPNNSLVYLTPGTYTITPHIVSSNGFGGINMFHKTNVTVVGYDSIINGHSAVGESLYITNSSDIRFFGITFDGLVVTNYTLAPTDRLYAGLGIYACDRVLIQDCKIINHHDHGIWDYAANAGISTLSTNVTIRNNYFFNIGSQTGLGIYDGAAIVPTGWLVEGNTIYSCLRGIEPYDETDGRVFQNCVIRDNYILNTLDTSIATFSSTNGHNIVIENNRIFNVPGFNRRGSNYFADAKGIWINGGQKHVIKGNSLTGTNYIGIVIGGNNRMDDIDITDNTIKGFYIGIQTGTALAAAGYHFGLNIEGNTIEDAYIPLQIISARNASVANNIINGSRFPNEPGLQLTTVGNLRNTNVNLINNFVFDESGTMDYGYHVGLGSSNIWFNGNASVGHTAGLVENLAGSGLIYISQLNNAGQVQDSPVALFGQGWLIDFIQAGVFGQYWGFSNQALATLSFYFQDAANSDDMAFTGNVRVGPVGASKIVATDASSNFVAATIGAGLSFVGGTLSTIDGGSITNAGNNTTVTADWNGPHWMRLQLSGTTTISFTNLPVASSTNGQTYTLELYAPTTVPTVTIQNIDPRAINWQGVGAPVLVDGITNFLTVRFDGTNFIGQSHQDRTIGTITSPYQLAYHSVSSNQNNKGALQLTNQPGDGAPILRFRQTNGIAYTEITTPDQWLPTNRLVLAFTNIAVDDVIKVKAVSISGGIATIILTNGLDNGGSGSPAGTFDGQVQYRSNGLFQADSALYFLATTDNLVISNNTSPTDIGLLVKQTAGRGVRVYPWGIHQIGSTEFLAFGVGGGSNWAINFGGHYYPVIDDTSDIGDFNNLNRVRNLYMSRQIVWKQHLIKEDITLTNIDLSFGHIWANNTNHATDSMYVITNGIPSEFVMHWFGRTNAAVNHTITITNAPGVTLNWVGSSTNGPSSLTLYSNSFLKIFGSATTNLTATNVYLTWLSDSIWPQRNQAIIASAGGSISNLTVGGLIYYDSQSYTNHSNAQNVTNYAFVMMPANILTNNGDSIIAEWDIMHQSGSSGTNQFFIGFGANTNIFNTGNMTNVANASAKLRAEITRTGNSSQHIFCEYEVKGGLGNVRFGIATNAEIAETCGITNILRMHGRKAGVNTPGNVGNHTNNQFKVWYQPISR